MIGNGRTGANRKGKIDVFINDQINPLFQYFLTNEEKTDILLTSDVAKDVSVIPVSSGHGFTNDDGSLITIFENNRIMQQHVKLVTDDNITIEYPIANPITTDSIVTRSNYLLSVDGSVTPVDFKFELRDFTIPIDVSKIILTAFSSGVPDDGKFMGINELTNGLWFRRGNEIDFNLGNYKNNQDFKNVGATIEYTDKAPSSQYATIVTFDLIDIFGQVMRFDARKNDTFCGQVRDNLSGLNKMIISLIGSYTDEN